VISREFEDVAHERKKNKQLQFGVTLAGVTETNNKKTEEERDRKFQRNMSHPRVKGSVSHTNGRWII